MNLNITEEAFLLLGIFGIVLVVAVVFTFFKIVKNGIDEYFEKH